MIARLNFMDEMEDALLHGTPERRAEWLGRVTDLFILGSGEYSDDHVALFDDVMFQLAAEIETSARASLAHRLAAVPNAPPNVIRSLAGDDSIEVAGPVLTNSDRLDEAALIDGARTKSQGHLLAISRRKFLAEAVTDVLVERGDRQVVQGLAENPGARFSEFGYTTLVKRAEGDDQLATIVGLRPEIPHHHFLKLLAKASYIVRCKLESANPAAVGEVRNIVSEVAGLIQARAGAKSRDYIAASAFVEVLHAAGKLGENEIEAFAKAGKFEETTAALAILCDMPIDAVETAMVQERSELVMVLVKSIGLSWRTAKAILLLRAGVGGISTHELEQQLKGYELLKPAVARQIVGFQRNRARRNPPGPAQSRASDAGVASRANQKHASDAD